MAKIDVNKLKALSKEEKIALYDKIQLKRKLDAKKRPPFTPHPQQLKVLLSDKAIRLVISGNGARQEYAGS
jgi:hypothetical protein